MSKTEIVPFELDTSDEAKAILAEARKRWTAPVDTSMDDAEYQEWLAKKKKLEEESKNETWDDEDW